MCGVNLSEECLATSHRLGGQCLEVECVVEKQNVAARVCVRRGVTVWVRVDNLPALDVMAMQKEGCCCYVEQQHGEHKRAK